MKYEKHDHTGDLTGDSYKVVPSVNCYFGIVITDMQALSQPHVLRTGET